jgi:hypothetical protein
MAGLHSRCEEGVQIITILNTRPMTPIEPNFWYTYLDLDDCFDINTQLVHPVFTAFRSLASVPCRITEG